MWLPSERMRRRLLTIALSLCTIASLPFLVTGCTTATVTPDGSGNELQNALTAALSTARANNDTAGIFVQLNGTFVPQTVHDLDFTPWGGAAIGQTSGSSVAGVKFTNVKTAAISGLTVNVAAGGVSPSGAKVGVYVTGVSSSIRVTGNHIDGSAGFTRGVLVQSNSTTPYVSSVEIDGNDIGYTRDDSMALYGVVDALVTGNIIHDMASVDGDAVHTDGLQVTKGTGVTVTANTISDTTAMVPASPFPPDNGVIFTDHTSNVTLDGNHFTHWDRGVTINFSGPDVTNFTVTNNDLHCSFTTATLTNGIRYASTAPTTESGNTYTAC